MTNHKYDVGQTIRFRAPVGLSAAPGEYEVVRRLPPRNGDVEYRIKSRLEPYERVATEHQMSVTP